MTPFASMVEAIGGTPLVRLAVDAEPGVEVYAKLELMNPFGMKDRVARQAILEARRTGALSPGAPIVESSSGTLALGVALVGRRLGHPVHIVTDPRIDPITLAKLRALGAAVDVVPAMTGAGWQSARLERLAEVLRERPDAFCPRQYKNPDNPRAYAELAGELLAELGTVDVLVGSVGSGGSTSGTARALRAAGCDLHVVGVDSVGSVVFGQPDDPGRRQSGLGNSLMPDNVDYGQIDEVHWLNDREAFAATRALAAEQGVFGGNTSGSVYRVASWLARAPGAPRRIVAILADRGDRYAGTVYDDAYWAKHGIDRQEEAQAPALLGRGEVARRWSRAPTRDAAPPAEEARLVFVESNTTGSGVLALDVARDLGLAPVMLTSAPDRYAGLAEAGCAVLRTDTNRLATLRATVQEELPRRGIAGVMTTSDFYLEAAAELTSWLGLPGNPVAAVAACRDKATCRALLARAGIAQPAFRIVDVPDAVAGAVADVGLPCVVKPADGSGSEGVRLCRSAREATEHVARWLARERNVRGQPAARAALVEEYVTGPELSVETFGRRVVGITRKTVAGLPHFVEREHLFPAPGLDAGAEAALHATALGALAAIGFGHGAAHVELKLTASGPCVVEVNGRLAGGMLPELIRLATGVDLLTQQLRAAVGRPPLLEPSHRRYAGIRFVLPDDAGVLRQVDGVERAQAVAGVERVAVTARRGQDVAPAASAYDRLGYVIAAGDSPEAVGARLDEAHSALSVVLA